MGMITNRAIALMIAAGAVPVAAPCPGLRMKNHLFIAMIAAPLKTRGQQ
jgi:hypothetical protein